MIFNILNIKHLFCKWSCMETSTLLRGEKMSSEQAGGTDRLERLVRLAPSSGTGKGVRGPC